MATHTLRQSFTLTTSWDNKTPEDFASVGATAYVPSATDLFRVINIESVTTQDASFCWGPRTGSINGNTRGLVGVPHPDHVAGVLSLNLGTETVTIVNDGEGDSGSKIDLNGKTHAQLRTAIRGRLTAGNTGVGGLVAADGPTDNLIVLQANSGVTDSISWSGRKLVDAWAHGMTNASSIDVAAGGTMPPIKELTDEPTSVIAMRSGTAGAVVVVEVEVQPKQNMVNR